MLSIEEFRTFPALPWTIQGPNDSVYEIMVKGLGLPFIVDIEDPVYRAGFEDLYWAVRENFEWGFPDDLP